MNNHDIEFEDQDQN